MGSSRRTVWLFYHIWLERRPSGRRGTERLRERRLDRAAERDPCLFALVRGRPQQLGDERGVHGVTGAVGGDLPGDRRPDEGQVADEVEDLVADEFVLEAQGTV